MHVATTLAGAAVAITGMVLVTHGTDAALVRGVVGLGMGCIILTYGVVFARGLGLLGSSR